MLVDQDCALEGHELSLAGRDDRSGRVMLPDGPRTPRRFQDLMLTLRPLESLDAYARRYGDPFTLGRNTARPSVYFSDPAALEEILSADTGLFDTHRRGIVPFLLGENSLVY